MSGTLVIQIPCHNERETLPVTVADLPRQVAGFDRVLVLVVDDGSTDGTGEAALAAGADYLVSHRRNRGLGKAFITGLTTALALGADVIVNTDADNQYPGEYIPQLSAPIVAGRADIVIGDRQPARNVHFSGIKRILEAMGSAVVRSLSATDAPDAASGFRAYSRYAALRLQSYNSYSYTLETLIQAGRERMAVEHLPIGTNRSLRPSRLHRGALNFIWHQAGTIIRSYLLYRPLRTFVLVGLPFLLMGLALIGRFALLYLRGESGLGRYVQSLTIGGTALLFGVLLIFMGLLADAMRANRLMMEEILAHLRGRQTITSNDSPEALGLPIRRQARRPAETSRPGGGPPDAK